MKVILVGLVMTSMTFCAYCVDRGRDVQTCDVDDVVRGRNRRWSSKPATKGRKRGSFKHNHLG